MKQTSDTELIRKFVLKCARARMTLDDMAASVGRTRGWASLLSNGKITHLQFGTRNRIREFLGEL